MTTLIFVAIAVLIVLFIVKVKIASNKPADQRSAFEKILTAMFVKHRQNMEEAAAAIRTPEISRTEALQKTKDAINDLKNGYQEQLRNIISTRDRLKEQLPTLKAQPGKWEGKARVAKGRMDKEDDEELKKTYKENALLYLSLKAKSLERIEKTEKSIKNIDTAIAKAQAEYEAKSSILSDMQIELESLASTVINVRFQDNMNIIRSLKQEVVDGLRDQNARAEAQNIVSSGENSTGSDVDTSAFENELANL